MDKKPGSVEFVELCVRQGEGKDSSFQCFIYIVWVSKEIPPSSAGFGCDSKMNIDVRLLVIFYSLYKTRGETRTHF